MNATTVVTMETSPQDVLAPEKGTVRNRTAQLVREGDRETVRLDARPGVGLAWWHDVAFQTGTIAFEVRGKNELQRSFVGVAFHGVQEGDDLSFEVVYFRPFNFLAADPVRRRHMVQYMAHPGFGWRKLREEQPERFEQPVQPAPNPDDWFAVRVEVLEKTVSVYMESSETPSLVVERLSSRRSGWVGFWVGDESDGDFAALKLTPPA